MVVVIVKGKEGMTDVTVRGKEGMAAEKAKRGIVEAMVRERA